MSKLTDPDADEDPNGSMLGYLFSRFITDSSSMTRYASDIYDEILRGSEYWEVWTDFMIKRTNELRMLFRGATLENQAPAGGADVFKGAHVVLNDNADWYYFWAKSIHGLRDHGCERWSSHYDKSRLAPKNQRYSANMESKEAQFEIYFPWNKSGMNWGCVLFGRYQEKNQSGVYVTKNRTWFQTEAHASTREGIGGKLLDPVLHILTGAVPYFATFKTMNVGPRGLSSYTESNPLYYKDPPKPPFMVDDTKVKKVWKGKLLARK